RRQSSRAGDSPCFLLSPSCQDHPVVFCYGHVQCRQPRRPRDVRQVAHDALTFLTRSQSRPPRWINVHRHNAGLKTAVRLPVETRDEGIDRLRMERRQSVGRIRLKTEQFLAAARPCGASRMVLAGVEGLRHYTAVTEAVEDHLAPVE